MEIKDLLKYIVDSLCCGGLTTYDNVYVRDNTGHLNKVSRIYVDTERDLIIECEDMDMELKGSK